MIATLLAFCTRIQCMMGAAEANWLTPRIRVLLVKLTSPQLVKKISAFYGTQKFTIVFISVHHLSLSWNTAVQSKPPHPTSWRSILILPSHLCLGLPIAQFSPPRPCMHLSCPIFTLSWPSNSWFDHLNNNWWRVQQVIKLSLHGLHASLILSLLGPNILFSTLYTNIISLCVSLNVTYQALWPYKATGKITVHYTEGKKILHWVIASIPYLQFAHNFFMNGILFC